jgi:hypothetical protein
MNHQLQNLEYTAVSGHRVATSRYTQVAAQQQHVYRSVGSKLRKQVPFMMLCGMEKMGRGLVRNHFDACLPTQMALGLAAATGHWKGGNIFVDFSWSDKQQSALGDHIP